MQTILFMQVPVELLAVEGEFPIAFTAVYVLGFVAAVVIGSIAWYNSKRPAGWEGKERPDFVPDIEKDKDGAE